MITAIDSNVLIDVILQDKDFAISSAESLGSNAAEGPLIVSEAVVAEIFPLFEEPLRIHDFLEQTGIRLEPSSMATLSRAGTAWDRYRNRERARLTCQVCGRNQSVRCEACGELLRLRQHLITDFLIGAHAAEQAEQLLTRDRGYFRSYFPDLKLV